MLERLIAMVALLAAALLVLAGCGSDATSPAPAHQQPSEERPAARFLDEPDDPKPVSLPEDAAPHDRLTEWWYYTGHVEDGDGNLYGFEFVIFQVLRGDFPPTYASHFAITDTGSGTFQYAERVQSYVPEPGSAPIDLDVGGWALTGGAGSDRITADMDGYTIDVQLDAEKPPVLHEGDGFFEFGPGAASYYYSRTRMRADGTLVVDGEPLRITGNAWMDHQWGNFLMLEGLGWDWFSAQLDNGHELMAWQSHDGEGSIFDGNATLVDPDGNATDVSRDDIQISPTGEWQSPRTGSIYPMGWIITVESHDIELVVEPVMEDQELITLDSTGVVYWEGMVTVAGTWDGDVVDGLGYVELTGYAAPPDG